MIITGVLVYAAFVEGVSVGTGYFVLAFIADLFISPGVQVHS